MSSVKAIKPEDFRLDDREIQKDPYPYYPVLREQAPVLRSRFGEQPCWVLSRREDIVKVLMDPATFSSHTTPIPNMLFADPPEHEHLRLMVSGMFTRAAVQPMSGPIADKSATLLADALLEGRCDIINDFAGPLTITVISLILGIAAWRVGELRRVTQLAADYVLSLRLGREPSPESRAANQNLLDFMLELFRSGDYAEGGVIAVLAEHLRKGELTQEQYVSYAVLLLVAGHSTTTNLIGNAVYMLTQHPADLERLAMDEAYVAPFVEEVLRTRPSFHRILRVTTKDVELGGEHLPAGSVVRLLLASANRDPECFDEAEGFDPTKKRRSHISFGQGIHFCLGNWLARLEAVAAMGVFSRCVASVRLDDTAPLLRLSGGTFNEFGFERLPVTLTARGSG